MSEDKPTKQLLEGQSSSQSYFDQLEIPRILLEWKKLRVFAPPVQRDKSSPPEEKELLFEVDGFANPGQILAIMGGSGSGKTTLMNQLAGHTYLMKGRVEGQIIANGRITKTFPFQDYIGYVMQEDVLLPTLSSYECFMFSADLRLRTTKQNKASVVVQILQELGLYEVRNTFCGGGLLKGLSGGQKKRTSIGIELITNPSVLFLDEPTSGLDSYTALTLIRMLGIQARKGRNVITTIHQPSSEIFNLIDRLIIVSQGHFIYQGMANTMKDFFADCGWPCDKHTNPADHFMGVIYIKNRINMDEKEVSTLKTLQEAYRRLPIENDKFVPSSGCELDPLTSRTGKRPVSWPYELFTLARRAALNVKRNPLLFVVRFIQAIITIAYIDLLFWDAMTNEDAGSIQSRNGLMQFTMMFTFFPSMQGVILTFDLERATFLREYKNNMYGTTTYYISKNMVELVPWCIWPTLTSWGVYWACSLYDEIDAFFFFNLILILVSHCAVSLGMLAGAAFKNVLSITATFSIFVLTMVLYGSFFTSEEDYHDYNEWVSYLSPFNYGYKALAVNEYEDGHLECQKDGSCNPLGELGFNDEDKWDNMLYLLILVVGFRFLGYVALKMRTIATVGTRK